MDHWLYIANFKTGMDSAEPSTNGVSANNLYRLGSILMDTKLENSARRTCTAFATEMLQHSFLFSSMLPSVVASNLGTSAVILCGSSDDPDVVKYRGKLRMRLLSNTTIAYLDPSQNSGSKQQDKWLLDKNKLLLEAMKGTEKKSRVQICQGTRCVDGHNTEALEGAFEELG